MEMEIHIHHRLHASAAFFLSLLSKLLLSFFNKIYNNNNHSRAKPSLSLSPSFALFLGHTKTITLQIFLGGFCFRMKIDDWKLPLEFEKKRASEGCTVLLILFILVEASTELL